MEESTDSSPIISGILHKKDDVNGLWHRRYCEMKNQTIFVSKTEKDPPELEIHLNNKTKVEVVDTKNPPRFIIHISESESVMFSNPDKNIFNQWVMIVVGATFNQTGLDMNSFKILSVLGRGFYGKVMLVEKKDTGELFAIKSIHKSFLIETGKTLYAMSELVNYPQGLVAGDHVNVVVSTSAEGAKFVKTIENVPVAGVHTEEGEVTGIEIYVTPEEAQSIAYAQANGQVSVALLPLDYENKNLEILDDGGFLSSQFGDTETAENTEVTE